MKTLSKAMKVTPTTVLAALVSLILIVAAFVLGVEFINKGDADSSLPVIAVLMGLVAPTITALLALLKAEGVQHDLNNGTVKNKVKEAITEIDDAKATAKAEAQAEIAKPVPVKKAVRKPRKKAE